MNCPRCDTVLKSHPVGDHQVEMCPSCGGMFLDRGELDRVAAPHEGDLEYSTLHGDSMQHDDEFGPTSCPRCAGEVMAKVEFNIYTNIILDRCGRCGGFWLDGKELERINAQVRDLEEADDSEGEPPMMWFARFIWSLPR